MSFVSPFNLMALAVAFMDITFVLLLLRGVTLRMTRKSMDAHDITLALAGLFTIAICISMITGTAYGVLGRAILPISLEKGKPLALATFSPPLQQNAQFVWAQQLMFLFQITLARLSIVLFYRRTLFPDPIGRFKIHWAIATISGVLGMWLVGFFFAYLFECGTQFSVIWAGPVLTQTEVCVTNNLELSASVTGVILDLIIVFLPLHRIMTLRLSPAKKIQVASAFMVGLLSVVGGTVRLAAIISALLKVSNILTTFTNPAMLSSNMAYWQVFEVGFAMTAAGLPGLRPFVNRVVGVVDSTFSSMASRSMKDKTSRNNSDAASFASEGKLVKMTIHKGQISKV